MKYVFTNWEIDQAYVLLEYGVKGGGNRGQYTDVRRYADRILAAIGLREFWWGVGQEITICVQQNGQCRLQKSNCSAKRF